MVVVTPACGICRMVEGEKRGRRGRRSYGRVQAGVESGYSSTRTESSSPHHSTREEGGPASLPSQVNLLET